MNAPSHSAIAAPPPLPPAAAPAARGWSRRSAMWLVVALTALAGLLRFAWLDYPDLWLDEAATYARTRGTFEQLMGVLANDGFTPLHYWLTWMIGQAAPLTARTLRAVPALAGTLMVPVMYLVSRRLGLRREASVVAALLAATSAWGFSYARDAKMYAPTWLLMTLSWGLFLGMVRGRPRVTVGCLRWLAWVVVSTAAIGYHGTAAISVALQLVLAPALMLGRWDAAATGPMRWPWVRLPAVGLGVILIAAGPAYYYWEFNNYIQRTGLLAVPTLPTTTPAVEDGAPPHEPDWRASGITWVHQYNADISPAGLALNTATSHLFGVQWPRQRVDPGYFTAPPPTWFVQGLHVAAAWLGLTMLAATLPWHRGTRRGVPWLGAVVVATWIAVPTYGVFYCRSFVDFSPPWGLLHASIVMWLTAGSAAIGLAAVGTIWRGMRANLAVGLLLAGMMLVGYSVLTGGWEWLAVARGVLSVPWLAGMLLGMWAAGSYLALGDTTRVRLVGLGRLVAGIAVVAGLCTACWAFWTWQQARVPEDSWKSIWMPRYIGVVWPALLIGVAAMLDRLPWAVWRWASVAVLVGLNVAQVTARLVVQTEPPQSLMAADFVCHIRQPDAYRVLYGLTDRPGLRFGGWDLPASVHLHIATGYALPPEDIFNSRIRRDLRLPIDRPTRDVVRGLSRDRPEVFVLWQRLGNGVTPSEPLQLEQNADLRGWRLIGQETFTQYQFWTWREGHTWVRWEYRPATTATTNPTP